jgi:release factor glutamine methyltransferase
MKIDRAVVETARKLEGRVASPSADARLLTMHAAVHDGVDDLSEQEQRLLDDYVARRIKGEPVQYITGRQGFRYLDLAVGSGVLVPRPETETVVEVALSKIAGVDGPKVVDLCTGSGAIAFSIATESKGSMVWAVDRSDEALSWTMKNQIALGLDNVQISRSDLFSSLPSTLQANVDLVVSNPPYLSETEILETPIDVRDFEPRIATVSGPAGDEVSLRIIGEASKWLKLGGWLVLETSPVLADRLASAASAEYATVQVHPDLNGLKRVIAARVRVSSSE